MSYKRMPSFYNFPVCVCKRCGNIVRILIYNKRERYFCRYCGTKYIVTKYSVSDDEAWLIYCETYEALDFLDRIYNEYLRENKRSDIKYQSERMRLMSRE